MGWWRQDTYGGLSFEDTGRVWGDTPADIMGDALDRIFAVFEAEWGRKPTEEELQIGLMFSARTHYGSDEDEDDEDARCEFCGDMRGDREGALCGDCLEKVEEHENDGHVKYEDVTCPACRGVA